MGTLVLYCRVMYHLLVLLPLEEAIATTAVNVIVSGLDGQVETLLEPAK